MSPRMTFEQELAELRSDVAEMGTSVESVYAKLFEVLDSKNCEMMEEIIHNDRQINDMQRTIEALCLTLLTKQQPVARDLREVSAALKVVTDIERVGDHVSDMAEVFLRMHMPVLAEFSDSLPKMVVATKEIVMDAIAAFVGKNVEAAERVIAYDDVIDAYFNQVKEDLIEDLKSGRKHPDDCIDMIMIAKYLERVGDHAVNIGEWAIFMETGDIENTRLL